MSSFCDGKRLSPIDELKSPTIHLIREIYETDNAHEHFIAELDRALLEKVDYIIIEPNKLGDETARWIFVGNCLSKTSIISGLASGLAAYLWPRNIIISGSLCIVSVFCTTLYAVSWNYDPACQYQVESNPKKLSKVPGLHDFSSPVVLVYKQNTKNKWLQRLAMSLALGYCSYRIYENFK